MISKKDNILSRIGKWIKGLFSRKKEVNINKRTNKNNKVEKNANAPQITGDGNTINIDNRTYNNIYNNVPNKDTITSPSAIAGNKEIKKEEKNFKQNEAENGEQSEKKQEMPQQEFERLLMKVKFIAFGIMGNIKGDKIKPLEFRKEEDKEFVQLVFEVEKKGCWIAYEITEKDKQRFLKTNISEIVERFITLHLVSYGRNDYFNDKCPRCKQTTLTRLSIINRPNEEAIGCNLCRGVNQMEKYLKYLDDKKHNPLLEFPEGGNKK